MSDNPASFKSTKPDVPAVTATGEGGARAVVGVSDTIAVVGITGDPPAADVNVGVFGTARDGRGVSGTAVSRPSANPDDVKGRGVYGESFFGGEGVHGETDVGIGVSGTSSEGVGVRGTSDFAPGVLGHSNAAPGVRGESVSDAGVIGTSANSTGVIGIHALGIDTSTFGAFGVAGSADSGTGVLGHSGTADGVRGESGTGVGVLGTTEHGSAAVKGVSTFDIGVVGIQGAGVDPRTIGVFGVAGTSDLTPGVFGRSNGDAGVSGESVTGVGVLGTTEHGTAAVFGTSDLARGVLGRSNTLAGVTGESETGPGVHGISTSGAAGIFDGNVIVNGALVVTGNKSAAVQSRDGSFRRLYAMESPESWFEDFGTAQLEDGHTRVQIDATYATLIRSDDYRVFLTPLGDCNGLYVDARSPQGFDVHELRGGTSDVQFDYRVVGKRADVTAPRLERMKPPLMSVDGGGRG